jgi:hypothetical protein
VLVERETSINHWCQARAAEMATSDVAHPFKFFSYRLLPFVQLVIVVQEVDS